MATHPIRIAIDNLPAHLATLKAELQEGHTVELVNGDEVIGEVHAHVRAFTPSLSGAQRPPMPDFMARMKAMWGDRVFPDSTPLIRKDRDGEL